MVSILDCLDGGGIVLVYYCYDDVHWVDLDSPFLYVTVDLLTL